MTPDFGEVLIRIAMAFLSAIVLGYEREQRGRAAGLRTTVLVCVAATIAAILSDHFYTSSFHGDYQSATWHPDPARLAAGILTGIGFLGAGVIIRHGTAVRGVTTASQIWLVTILGLCYGNGQLLLGLVGTTVSFCTVFLLHYVEDQIRRDWYASLTVTVSVDGASVDDVSALVKQKDIHLENLELMHDAAAKTRTMTFSLQLKGPLGTELPDQLVASVVKLPGVQRVDWK